MEKANWLLKMECILEISKMEISMDMVNLIGKMDQFIEGILKMVSVMVKVNSTIQKIQVLREVFGKMEYWMVQGNTMNPQEWSINVCGKIIRLSCFSNDYLYFLLEI